MPNGSLSLGDRWPVRRLVALTLMVLVNCAVGALSQEIKTFLSKDAARVMFSMTKDQWHSKVQQAVAAGAAEAIGTPDTGWGMAMTTPEGDLLMVEPNYGDVQKPDFIQVTIGYSQSTAARLSDSDLQEVIEAARAQMEPEYDVIGVVERPQGGLFFIIAERQTE